MQITKELIEADIKGVTAQLENQKTLVAQSAGALSVLNGILEYLNREEPTEAIPEAISSENASVQDAVELSQIAEAVAGPGAVVEDIVALPPAAEIWEQPIDRSVAPEGPVDVEGRYPTEGKL